MALNDVPQPGQTLGGTQNPIRQNFLTVEAAFIVDHVDYGAALQGEHLKVTFTTQVDNPLPVIASNQFVMYNTTPTIADNAAYPVTLASNEICILRQSTGKSIPITASAANAAGWAYLPSGILMKWGVSNFVFSGDSIVFPAGLDIPVFQSTPFNIQITPLTSNALTLVSIYWDIPGSSTTQFKANIYNTFKVSTSASFSWLAIGN